jgi:hypothetical protein
MVPTEKIPELWPPITNGPASTEIGTGMLLSQQFVQVERFYIKLQRLSMELQRWSQRKVGNIKIQLSMAKEVFHHIEIARDRRALSSGKEREEKTQSALSWTCLP